MKLSTMTTQSENWPPESPGSCIQHSRSPLSNITNRKFNCYYVFFVEKLLSNLSVQQQLYVVVSREGLKILITDEDDEDTNETSNVVYEEVFRNVLYKYI